MPEDDASGAGDGLMGRLFRFELHDGTSGSVIYPEPVTIEQVTADCHARFGVERVREVKHG